jgi:beta-lactamase regulating signal transducer with metallopeptidase domain
MLLIVCVLYALAVGACLSAVGYFMERALPAAWPRRGVWCFVIALTVTAPCLLQLVQLGPRPVAIELPVLAAMPVPSGHAHGAAAHAAPDAAWWAQGGSFERTFLTLWALTSAVLLAWGLAGAWRVSRIARNGRNARTAVDGVAVTVTGSLGPATVGCWRPRVVVPRWVLALPGPQRRYVIRHEEEHRRAHDVRLLGVASLLVTLVPWCLPLWWQLRRLRLAVEMDCDRRVVAALGDVSTYGALLLRVAQAASRGPHLQPALVGSAGTLERRLTALLAPAPRRVLERVVAPALAFALLLVVLSVPHPRLVPERRASAHIPEGAATPARQVTHPIPRR